MRSVTPTEFYLQKESSACTKWCFMSVPGSQCQHDLKWDSLRSLPHPNTRRWLLQCLLQQETMQLDSILGACKLGTCHQDGISWNNCSGLPAKEEWLLVPGRAHHPLFLDCLSPTTRSRARLVFSLYLQSSSSVGNCGKGSLFNYRQFRVSENIFRSQVYGQTYILFKCFKDSSFPES